MKRTQIQLPDWLFTQARDLARQREISLAELIRRGLEHILAVTPSMSSGRGDDVWELPPALDLGSRRDALEVPSWREAVHMDRLKVAEDDAPYGGGDAQ